MKKLSLCLLVVALTVFATGCGKKKAEEAPVKVETTTPAPMTTPAPEATPAAATTTTPAPAPVK